MVKRTISYYSEVRTSRTSRVSLSLRLLPLKFGKTIEDIFYALEDSDTFEELTKNLASILDTDFVVDRIRDGKYIRYALVAADGSRSFLKFAIKSEEDEDDAEI